MTTIAPAAENLIAQSRKRKCDSAQGPAQTEEAPRVILAPRKRTTPVPAADADRIVYSQAPTDTFASTLASPWCIPILRSQRVEVADAMELD
ncbi:hypothetical protein BDK51DRAFT_36467 [Blyttiomyces helicus]|uniref:Uncharacterized protein n=1 Tax=Blyttiomyces helicus TaxID=388810 RepID=A0A4P9WFH9_9FUNG|nr:hypothetical protein BDK51DRAFT_36467 [Blyttiomyces helicus]|eukprot:RKO91509.1 hypothetical protein BDK51DRAFT_36467 [Blyttiomyces helicus]